MTIFFSFCSTASNKTNCDNFTKSARLRGRDCRACPDFLFFYNFLLLMQAVGSRAELLSFLAYLLAQKLDIGTHGVTAYRHFRFPIDWCCASRNSAISEQPVEVCIYLAAALPDVPSWQRYWQTSSKESVCVLSIRFLTFVLRVRRCGKIWTSKFASICKRQYQHA